MNSMTLHVLLGFAAALLAGCGDGPSGPGASPPEPPVAACVPDPSFATDSAAPAIIRVFPDNAFFHDRDDDGLVDLELAFDDGEEGAGVEPASVALAGPGGRDLLPTWEVTERSAGRLVVEETIAGLLPHGREIPIAVTVVDRACNRAGSTIALGELRPAALHTTIDVGDGNPFRELEDLVINPEGTRLYAVDQTAQLTVVDPNAYRLIERIDGPVGDLHGIVADWAGNRLFAVGFAGPGLAEFDATTGRPIRRIETTQGAFTLAVSKRTSEIYIPLEEEFVATQGFLSVVDRSEGREVAVIEAGLPPRSDNGILNQHGAVLSKDESVLFVASGGQRGLHVWSPRERRHVAVIDLNREEGPDRLGSVLDVDRHAERIYAGAFRGRSGGALVVEVDETMEISRSLEVGQLTDFNRLEVSPDGKRLFVSGFSSTRLSHQGPPNYLINVDQFQVMQRLEGLPREFGYFDAAWHPDGTRIYVASTNRQGGNRIVVYLVRPDA